MFKNFDSLIFEMIDTWYSLKSTVFKKNKKTLYSVNRVKLICPSCFHMSRTGEDTRYLIWKAPVNDMVAHSCPICVICLCLIYWHNCASLSSVPLHSLSNIFRPFNFSFFSFTLYAIEGNSLSFYILFRIDERLILYHSKVLLIRQIDQTTFEYRHILKFEIGFSPLKIR